MIQIYSDGGLLSANPSLVGGAICYVHASNGNVCRLHSRVILLEDYPGMSYISNNLVEALAIIEGLNACDNGEAVEIFTDSDAALNWITKRRKVLNGWTNSLMELYNTALDRVHIESAHIIAGHPTRKDLANGFKKSGHPSGKETGTLPVSSMNVLCDKEVTRTIKKWHHEQKLQELDRKHQICASQGNAGIPNLRPDERRCRQNPSREAGGSRPRINTNSRILT